jgi:Cu(I)/Ag(I) efflux system protein CusF
MKYISTLALSVLVGLSAVSTAAFADHHAHSGAPAAKQTRGAAGLSEGLVKKVDKKNQTITIRHGELKSLDMPPMIMAFRVKTASMLNGVKAGDKVRFKADKVDGEPMITQIVK